MSALDSGTRKSEAFLAIMHAQSYNQCMLSNFHCTSVHHCTGSAPSQQQNSYESVQLPHVYSTRTLRELDFCESVQLAEPWEQWMRLGRQRECEWLFWLGKVSADWGATDYKTAWTAFQIPVPSKVSDHAAAVFTKQAVWDWTSCGSLGSSASADVFSAVHWFFCTLLMRSVLEIQSVPCLETPFAQDNVGLVKLRIVSANAC